MQVVALEKAAQEVGDDALQVGEADVLAHPQAFDLMEHRRVRGIGIDTIDAAGADHAQLGHTLQVLVLLDMSEHRTDLHRAGMRAQQ